MSKNKPEMFGVIWDDTFSLRPRCADEECTSLREAYEKAIEGMLVDGQEYAQIVVLKLKGECWVENHNYPAITIDATNAPWSRDEEDDEED